MPLNCKYSATAKKLHSHVNYCCCTFKLRKAYWPFIQIRTVKLYTWFEIVFTASWILLQKEWLMLGTIWILLKTPLDFQTCARNEEIKLKKHYFLFLAGTKCWNFIAIWDFRQTLVCHKMKPLAAFSFMLRFPLCVQLYLWNFLTKGNLMFFWHDWRFESSFENKATDSKRLFLL